MIATPERKALPIRVLVVDDSVVVRRLVAHGLSEDPEIEVVGSASNGVSALKMIPLVKPDVMTLDIEMPDMNGLETLRKVRETNAELKIIMFSTLSERGASITLQALSLGANDYVTKPANVGSLDISMARLREELVPKVKQFFRSCGAKMANHPVKAVPPDNKKTPSVARAAVAIGVSTGGPSALAQVIPALPDNFALPVFVVQHMPPVFTRLLAERLQSCTKLRVREAANGMSVENGTVYIAAGDHHMRVTGKGNQKTLTLDQAAPENFCRPAVDVLFRSVADVYGGSTIAVMLTGMGQDGRLGTERLRHEGAWVIAQDERSSVVWGMPGAVVRAGLADAVVDLSSIVPEILRQYQKR